MATEPWRRTAVETAADGDCKTPKQPLWPTGELAQLVDGRECECEGACESERVREALAGHRHRNRHRHAVQSPFS